MFVCPFIPLHNKMDITSIFIQLTEGKQSITNERNAKESEGILDFPFTLSRISGKQPCFHPGAVLFLHMCCCAAGEVSTQLSGEQLRVFVLAFGCRCTIEPKGRKWRGGVWMWHKQETSFVFPSAQWCTRKVYSKRCPCTGLSNKICFARGLHNRRCWRTKLTSIIVKSFFSVIDHIFIFTQTTV